MRLLAIIAALGCCHIGQAATTKLEPRTIAYWQAMHRCEQPDAWHHSYREYKGGLGISNGAWDWWAGELGLLRRYPTAGHAPPLVQIRVAQWGWSQHRGNWGCMRAIGYPP